MQVLVLAVWSGTNLEMLCAQSATSHRSCLTSSVSLARDFRLPCVCRFREGRFAFWCLDWASHLGASSVRVLSHVCLCILDHRNICRLPVACSYLLPQVFSLECLRVVRMFVGLHGRWGWGLRNHILPACRRS